MRTGKQGLRSWGKTMELEDHRTERTMGQRGSWNGIMGTGMTQNREDTELKPSRKVLVGKS